MEFHCVDRDCFVEHKVESICIAYQPDSSPNCSIPCALENCAFTVLHEVLCPIYHCIPSTTTTPTPTSTPGPDMQSPAIVSYVFNGLLSLAMLIVFLYFLNKYYKKRNERQSRMQLLNERLRLNRLLQDRHERQRLINPVVRFSVRDSQQETNFAAGAAAALNAPGLTQDKVKKYKVSFENVFKETQTLIADQETDEFEEIELA